jgi:hypothetical protein
MKNRSHEIKKPLEHINKLICHFSPAATRKVVPEHKKIYYNKNKHQNCYLLIDGECAIRSLTDHKIIATIRAPFILGFGIDANTYLQTLTESVFDILPVARAQEIIDQEQLWEPMFHFYRRVAAFLYQRAQALNRPNSRQVVLSLLENLNNEPDHYKFTASVIHYIQSNSALSRSSIYNIISQLKNEGLITIKNGRLIALKTGNGQINDYS